MKPMRERTKWMFADAIFEIITKKDLAKIRVTELCEYCGTDRQTFYYHFKDKYDLVAWIYQNDLNFSLQQFGDYYCEEQTKLLLNLIREKQFFYRKAFEDTNQNSLFSYMRNANSKVTEHIFKKNLHLEELSEEQLFTIKYNSYAWVGCLSEWVTNKCSPAPEIFVNYLYYNTADIPDTSSF